MPRSLVIASFSLVVVTICAAGLHCGSSVPGATPPVGPKSSADACLALASIKRGQSPTEPARITAQHVLVQYQGAKTAKVHIVRFRDEACLRAMQARDELRAGANFAEVVSKYSDEPGGDARAGSLGSIERKDVVPLFADAAFELMPRELSDVVETEFGFHVILRTE